MLVNIALLIMNTVPNTYLIISYISPPELSLPDTLFSWFLVTELHCWLVMTRAMAEGEEGRVMRNGLVEALWQDVATRIRRMEVR